MAWQHAVCGFLGLDSFLPARQAGIDRTTRYKYNEAAIRAQVEPIAPPIANRLPCGRSAEAMQEQLGQLLSPEPIAPFISDYAPTVHPVHQYYSRSTVHTAAHTEAARQTRIDSPAEDEQMVVGPASFARPFPVLGTPCMKSRAFGIHIMRTQSSAQSYTSRSRSRKGGE